MAFKEELAIILLKGVVKTDFARNILEKRFLKWLYQKLVEENPKGRPRKVQEDKYLILKALLKSAERNIERGYFSKQVAQRMIDTLVRGAFLREEKPKEITYEEKYGYGPPAFLVLSPTKRCNLRCIGCYAASDIESTETLEFSIQKRIIREANELWGVRFIVISGGEPMMMKSEGKDILDLYSEFPHIFFMMYTNGTLITRDVAKRMAELGNITPAISVEGFEVETDRRRGKGIFKRLLKTFDYLKEAGVPFGVSVTATRQNVHLLVGDEFYDYYFDEIGATYMWIFQYMPIGRDFTLSLMPTPEERLKMYWQWRKEVEEKERFVADFWNSGVVSDGCIAYGRPGGYFYIDWNGNVMPCVFVPYYVDNIKEVYRRGGNLNDVIHSDFFKRGREWQFSYAYMRKAEEMGNLLRPCSIRDHHEEFRRIVDAVKAKPENREAEEALKDEKYYEGLVEYDRRLEELTGGIWKSMFLKKKELKRASG